MKAFTDYPFVSLGDLVYEKAPIRRCVVFAYDGDKYCRIVVDGEEEEVKLGYLYSRSGRCGEVPVINTDGLLSY